MEEIAARAPYHRYQRVLTGVLSQRELSELSRGYQGAKIDRRRCKLKQKFVGNLRRKNLIEMKKVKWFWKFVFVNRPPLLLPRVKREGVKKYFDQGAVENPMEPIASSKKETRSIMAGC